MEEARKKGRKERVNRLTSFPFMELFYQSPGYPTSPQTSSFQWLHHIRSHLGFCPEEKGKPWEGNLKGVSFPTGDSFLVLSREDSVAGSREASDHYWQRKKALEKWTLFPIECNLLLAEERLQGCEHLMRLREWGREDAPGRNFKCRFQNWEWLERVTLKVKDKAGARQSIIMNNYRDRPEVSWGIKFYFL